MKGKKPGPGAAHKPMHSMGNGKMMAGKKHMMSDKEMDKMRKGHK